MEFFGSFDEFLSIGGLSIKKYAICILIGAAIAAYISLREGKKLGLNTTKILDGILFGLPIGIVGARLFYVIFEWDTFYSQGDFFDTLGNVFDISGGGLSITGGIIFAIIYTFIYCRVRKINLLNILDLLGPGMLVAQACGRWGNFFNKEAYGGKMSDGVVDIMYKILPDYIMDNMYISQAYRHPTFLYESLWNLVGLAIIVVLRNKCKKIQLGDYIGLYLIWYGIGRSVLIEPFRTDALMLGDLRINVIIPALFAVCGVIYLIVKHLKFPQESYLLSKEKFISENPDLFNELPLKEKITKKFKEIIEFDEKDKKNDANDDEDDKIIEKSEE